MHLHFRKAELNDAADLQAVYTKAYLEHFKYLWDDEGEWYLQKNFTLERLISELQDPNAIFFLAYFNDVLVGYMKLNVNAPLGDENDGIELERIYIIKEATGKEIGKELADLSVEIAKKKGKRFVWLKAMDSSKRAISFYEKMGFHICGSHSLDFAMMKSEYRGMVIMQKDLN